MDKCTAIESANHLSIIDNRVTCHDYTNAANDFSDNNL